MVRVALSKVVQTEDAMEKLPLFKRGGVIETVWLIVLAFLFLLPCCSRGQEANIRDTVKVDEKTDAVIKSALKFLASKQLPNGAWGTAEEETRHPIAITGYTLMAFQAAGQLPAEGG